MNYVKLLMLFLVVLIFTPKPTWAAEPDSNNQFITIVNPIRISKYTKNPLDSFEAQYRETIKRNLPATWLLTYDVLDNLALTANLSKIDKSQELGIFLEITPDFATQSGVEYNKTDSWHRAHAVFLSGYKQVDRIRLINTVFEKFKQVFGFYPISVGAWWIDSYSLEYMQKKYHVVANLGLADQFATDGYQVWGQYWSTPFIPNKYHAGIPASQIDNKLNLVTTEWALRDPLNGYLSSLYSTQDYFTINLEDDYFSKLLDLYLQTGFNKFGQITIGLETDFDPSSYQGVYARQLDIAKSKKAKFLTMTDFSNWYLHNFQVTPPQSVITDDLLGSQKKAIWYQSSSYRIGLEYDGKTQETKVLDFRVYPDDFVEPNYKSPNKLLNLYINLPSVIDLADYTGLNWNISKKKLIKITRKDDYLNLNFRDGSIKFTKNNIQLHNLNPLPAHLKTTPLLKVSNWFSNTSITPQSKYYVSRGGLHFRGLTIKAAYFLMRPKIKLFLQIVPLLCVLIFFFLIKSRLSKKVKLTALLSFSGILIVGGLILFYSNSQIYEVGQSEADALLHLAALPYGKVVVYNGGCLICNWNTDYPPPFFANNRGYVQTLGKKPIVYNSKIFKASNRAEGRQELKRLRVKYIYITKFEDYQETLPFSPGDYLIDMVYENANAQIWKVRDNSQL